MLAGFAIGSPEPVHHKKCAATKFMVSGSLPLMKMYLFLGYAWIFLDENKLAYSNSSIIKKNDKVSILRENINFNRQFSFRVNLV